MMQIKKATRQGIKPLIVLYGESGCGKTLSALYLARGFAGPDGKIVLTDSESGRGMEYANALEGGYEVLDLSQPFSPARYREAIDTTEQSGAVIGIIDSGSHEWEGIGGVLDMAAENEAKKGKGLHCWNGPKMEHSKFLLRLLQSSIPWIVCLRAKYKTRQVKNGSKTEIVKDDYTTPIQADDFIFEANAHMEILHDHSVKITKASTITGLDKCFPTKGPITIEHGRLLREWCNAPKGPGTHQPAKQSTDPLKALKKKLWDLTQEKHQGDKAILQRWLIDEACMDPDWTLDTMTEAQLKGVILNVERKILPVTP
jgi:hypothetical protein